MKQFPTTSILNIPILSLSKRELLDSLDKGMLFTPNLDHLVKLQSDKRFFEAYSEAEWIVCDSRVLRMCSRLLRRPIPEAIPGSSFFTDYYLHHASDQECRIFLLGAREGVADEAARHINSRVGRDIIVGTYSPPFGFENDPAEIEKIISKVNASDATVCLVGLGAPKQELFISAYRNQMPGIRLWMALGATIDFEAGNIRRAPKWVQKICMEWFYRFLCEPKRMFRRYFVDDIRFFLYFTRQLTGRYRSPF